MVLKRYCSSYERWEEDATVQTATLHHAGELRRDSPDGLVRRSKLPAPATRFHRDWLGFNTTNGEYVTVTMRNHAPHPASETDVPLTSVPSFTSP